MEQGLSAIMQLAMAEEKDTLVQEHGDRFQDSDAFVLLMALAFENRQREKVLPIVSNHIMNNPALFRHTKAICFKPQSPPRVSKKTRKLIEEANYDISDIAKKVRESSYQIFDATHTSVLSDYVDLFKTSLVTQPGENTKNLLYHCGKTTFFPFVDLRNAVDRLFEEIFHFEVLIGQAGSYLIKQNEIANFDYLDEIYEINSLAARILESKKIFPEEYKRFVQDSILTSSVIKDLLNSPRSIDKTYPKLLKYILIMHAMVEYKVPPLHYAQFEEFFHDILDNVPLSPKDREFHMMSRRGTLESFLTVEKEKKDLNYWLAKKDMIAHYMNHFIGSLNAQETAQFIDHLYRDDEQYLSGYASNPTEAGNMRIAYEGNIELKHEIISHIPLDILLKARG